MTDRLGGFIRALVPDGAAFFVPVCGENGDCGRKTRKIIPYYGNTMDCACVELRTFAT